MRVKNLHVVLLIMIIDINIINIKVRKGIEHYITGYGHIGRSLSMVCDISFGGGDYVRGVPPRYIEYVLSSVSGVKQANGNYSYISCTLEVVINVFGA